MSERPLELSVGDERWAAPQLRASWWERSIGAAPSAHSRRAALQGILAAGGVLAGLGTSLPDAQAQGDPYGEPPPDVHTEARRALDMQRQYGWSFGAATES